MSAIEKSFNLINELNTSIHLLDPELELDSSVVIKLQRIDRFENTLDSLEDAGQDYKDYLADLKKYLSGDPNSLIQNPVKNKNFDPLDAKLVMEDMFNRLKEVQKQLEEQLSKKRLQIQAVILHLIK
jgi:glycosylphosphatidylinositol transamidase (GPIT) subunit GPI8